MSVVCTSISPFVQLGDALRLEEKVEGVRAAAPGVVEAVGYAPHYEGYGRVVPVDLGGSLEALYAHLDQAAVTVGQQVSTGEHLGIAGCTGTCFGTHLHFELRERGIASGAWLAQRAWHRFFAPPSRVDLASTPQRPGNSPVAAEQPPPFFVGSH